MKHRDSSTHRINAPDRHNGQPNKQANKTNGRVSFSFDLFVPFLSYMEFNTNHANYTDENVQYQVLRATS